MTTIDHIQRSRCTPFQHRWAAAATILIVLVGIPGLLAMPCAHAKPAWALFKSRVAYEPLRAKLARSGGSEAKVLHPRRLADLVPLQSSHRYKFVVLADGRLAIAPLPADQPGNEYVHPVLAAGAAVRTAGGLRIEREDDRIVTVVLDQESKAYCPTLDSLTAVEDALKKLGVPATVIRRDDRAPECAPETK